MSAAFHLVRHRFLLVQTYKYVKLPHIFPLRFKGEMNSAPAEETGDVPEVEFWHNA